MSDIPPPPAPAGEDKTIAMLAYLTPLLCGVGFIIAVLMHNKNKTALGAYHLRQSLGLLIVAIALAIVFTVIGLVVGSIPVVGMLFMLVRLAINVGVFVLWILGLMSALKCEQKPVPVLGPIFQEKLASLFT